MKDLKELATPFAPEDIEWRVQQLTKNKDKVSVLAYLTSRAVMDRLDEVCGPENWRNEYEKGPDGGILCGISIKIGDEWVTKWDGAENTDIEKVKGGLSNAMKRAAVQWGIGRYLYNLPSSYVLLKQNGTHRFYDKKTETSGYWDEPRLPNWALPGAPKTEPRPSATEVVQSEQEVETTSVLEEMTKPATEAPKVTRKAKGTPLEPGVADQIEQVTELEEAIKKSLGRTGSEARDAWRKASLNTTELATCTLAALKKYHTSLLKYQIQVQQTSAQHANAN